MFPNYAKGVLVTMSDCADVAKENEYNKWFNEVLIPKIQELSFVGDCNRFENVMADTQLFAGRPKYLALYDLEADDMYEAFAQIRAKVDELKAEGRDFPEHTPLYDTVYERFTRPYLNYVKLDHHPVQGVYTVFNYCSDPAQETAFNNWYTKTHMTDTIKCGSWDSANRYKLVDSAHPAYHQPPHLTIYETTFDPLRARNDMLGNRDMWVDDPVWTELLQLNWTGGWRLFYTAKNKNHK